MTSRYRFLPVALPLILGCATGRSASGPGTTPAAPDERVTVVRVTNNLTPRTPVTVRLEALSGSRLVLGSVAPGAIRELGFSETVFATQYQLVATRADGSAVVSRGFQLFPKALVTWSLKANVLQVTER